MPQTARFTVSLDMELLAAFDHHIVDRGYGTRSEAIREMIRDLLTERRLQVGEGDMAAILSLACNFQNGRTYAGFRAMLVANPDLVDGWHSVPIDKDQDAIAVMLHGSAKRVQEFADKLRAIDGISRGQLSIVQLNEAQSPD